MQLTQLQVYNKAGELLEFASICMSEIHEKLHGKENLQEREELLKPLRKVCVALGDYRYQIVRK